MVGSIGIGAKLSLIAIGGLISAGVIGSVAIIGDLARAASEVDQMARGVIRIVGKLMAVCEALEREVETLLREVRNA